MLAGSIRPSARRHRARRRRDPQDGSLGRMRFLPVTLLWMGLLLAIGGGAPSLVAQEVATVMVRGEPLFTIPARGDTSAVVRAQRIAQVVEERLRTDEPLAPVRVAAADTGAVILVAGDTLFELTRRDVEVATARPAAPGAALRLAREWAQELRGALARIAQEERERVVVDGIPLFEVGGTSELRAARRAAAIGLRVRELAAAPEAPQLRVVQRRGGAAVLGNGKVIAEVSAQEARARGLAPAELAQLWSEEIHRVVEVLRGERGWEYTARLVGLALAASLFAVVVHGLLRRTLRRRDSRHRLDDRVRESFSLVATRWAIHLLQIALWTALTVFLLWLFPRTRPFVYAAVERSVDAFDHAVGWLLSEGPVIALIVVTTYLIARFLGEVVRHLVRAYGMRHGGRVALRAETLAGAMEAAVQLLVFFLGVLAVLAQLDVDPAPLIASAGVAGIAIGFGVQSLIRDFFTGFFILLEDQYGVGDVIRVGGNTGKVENLTLRVTQIRGIDGSLTSIPNGEILTVTNLSKDWAQAVLDVRIALGEDVGRATEVIRRVASSLASEWPERVREEPEILGVESVDPAARAITIRVLIKTAPLEQWAVSRELRRRLVEVFRAEGIEVPPHSPFTISGGGGEVRPPAP